MGDMIDVDLEQRLHNQTLRSATMNRAGTRGFGRGGGGGKFERYPSHWARLSRTLTSNAARGRGWGGGRGGFQQRDHGPPDSVLGTPQHLSHSPAHLY